MGNVAIVGSMCAETRTKEEGWYACPSTTGSENVLLGGKGIVREGDKWGEQVHWHLEIKKEPMKDSNGNIIKNPDGTPKMHDVEKEVKDTSRTLYAEKGSTVVFVNGKGMVGSGHELSFGVKIDKGCETAFVN